MQIIETDRLILRRNREDEFESNYCILVEELEGAEFTRDAYVPEFQFDLYFAQQNLGQQFWRPSIVLKDTQRFIGYCLLMPRLCTSQELAGVPSTVTTPSPFNSLEAEIGWAISERYRNLGYASEAARALIDYGFRELRLPRIIALTERSNSPSIRVMEKLGLHIRYQEHIDCVVGMIENASQAL